MKIKPFHMPEIEPGTLIRVRGENGGGYLLSCPQCNFLRFIGATVLYWTAHNLIDTPQEICCSNCGVMFQIIGNEFKYDIYHDETEAKRRKPELKTYGTQPEMFVRPKERVTA